MSEIFYWLYVVAAVILLFGAAVFVHEWGHYYMARKRGLKVEAFAIGFGPKIFGWRKDGIDYPADDHLRSVGREGRQGTASAD